jgi:hypothetical protein
MTTRVHLQNPQNPTDDSVFGLGNTDNADPVYAQVPTLDFASAGMPATSPPAPTLTQVLYLTEPGTTNPISVADINQGQLGDCFLLSSIGEEALFHPSAITNMIRNNGNGTETVTLYTAATGRPPTFSSASFKATAVTINNSFPANSVNNGAKQDVVGTQKEIWPQVLEKAVATLDGGYNAVANGGYPALAMEELTGHVATSMSIASLTLSALQSYVSAGDLITMDTSSHSGLPYGLVSDHCYMFEKLNGSGSSTTVTLGNPWGMDQPAAIPVTRLAQSGVVQIDIGHVG